MTRSFFATTFDDCSEEPAAPAEKEEPAETPKKMSSKGDAGTGSVTGVIKLTGGIPELAPLIKKGDESTC